MKIVKTPNVTKKILRKFSWNYNQKRNIIYLTFDDGPTPKITEQILNILKEYKAKATFFCVGKNVEKFPDIYNKILLQGHTTGNHTYSHLNGWKTPKEEYIKDVQLATKYIKSDLFRPPYGKIKPSQHKELLKDYRIVLWNILSWDFDKKTTKEKCFKNITRKTQSGDIILFHDTEKAKENLFYVLPRFLETFTKKGYCFEAIK